LHKSFRGFVSPSVLKEIIAGRLSPSLAGERREVCVLFSDIRSFTTLSENLPPEEVSDLLNRYFERMASAIHRHGGTLDKFIGDGIMAFFGAPQASADPVGDAFKTARDMLTELDHYNREQDARGAPHIAIGIGLHFGSAFIGYVGSHDRHEYSAIGDTVNTASRLEGLTKEAGYPVVMSATVRQRLGESAACVDLGDLPIKGRTALRAFGWKP
jgi:adenylate cyclase